MKNQTNSPKEPQPNKCDDSGPKLLPMSIINLNKEPKLRYEVKEKNIKTLSISNTLDEIDRKLLYSFVSCKLRQKFLSTLKY